MHKFFSRWFFIASYNKLRRPPMRADDQQESLFPWKVGFKPTQAKMVSNGLGLPRGPVFSPKKRFFRLVASTRTDGESFTRHAIRARFQNCGANDCPCELVDLCDTHWSSPWNGGTQPRYYINITSLCPTLHSRECGHEPVSRIVWNRGQHPLAKLPNLFQSGAKGNYVVEQIAISCNRMGLPW